MKLRLFTGMLLMIFLSVFNSSQANAHEGCKTNCCSKYHHHGCWGHQGYIYGPDGYFAKHKSACCDKKEDKKCSASKSCCDKSSAATCGYTYRRAYYSQDCCGHGHLHTSCGKSKSCSKDKDNDNDD